MKKVVVIGAGLAGSLLSLYLSKYNYLVDVYEKRSDMRKSKIERGRSINLAISKRGIDALKNLSLDQDILRKAIPMHSRMIHSLGKESVRQSYGRNNNEHIDSISRTDLNIDLLNHLDKQPGVRVFFDKQITDIDFDSNELTVYDSNSSNQEIVRADVIIASDGGPSTIRNKMVKQGIADFRTEFLSHGYKELTIDKIFSKKLDKHCLHIWPRSNFMLIALPDYEGSFTCTLFLSLKDGEYCLNNLNTKKSVSNFFTKYFPDVKELIPNLEEQFLSNPIGELATLKGAPWFYKDKILLMGDSAHAIVPFFGQGMNCAFEDCRVFGDLLKKFDNNWESLFKSYFISRKKNTDAIADMAVENFFEMSKHTANERFLLYKSVEKALMKRFPDKYISRYVLISFTLTPYKLSQICGVLQKEFLDKICKNIVSIEELDWHIVETELKIYLNKLEQEKIRYRD